MWKPSVNAIWLRAAPRSAASGRRLRHQRRGCGRALGPARRSTLASSPSITALWRSPKRAPIHSMSTSTRRPVCRRGSRGARRGRWRTPAGPRASAPDLADRLAPADDGQRALVEVAERRGRPRPALADRLRDVVRLLDRDRRQPGERLAVGPAQARRRRRSPRSRDGRARVRSGLTSMRPPRSVLAPVAWASASVSGTACTPAAQMTVRAVDPLGGCRRPRS